MNKSSGKSSIDKELFDSIALSVGAIILLGVVLPGLAFGAIWAFFLVFLYQDLHTLPRQQRSFSTL